MIQVIIITITVTVKLKLIYFLHQVNKQQNPMGSFFLTRILTHIKLDFVLLYVAVMLKGSGCRML